MSVSSALIISYHSSLNNGDRALLETNMRQLRLAFDNPKISVMTQWPDEPYFKQAVDFEPLPSAWRLIGLSAKNNAAVEIPKYLLAEGYARAYKLGLKKLIPAQWRRVFDAYQSADIIASVSSTHFYSTGRYGWPFPVKIFMANLAHLFGKPLVIMPQSIGPLRWQWEKSLLRAAFGKAQLVLLRDQASMRLAQNIGLPAGLVRYAPDPAFAYPPADASKALAVLNRYQFNPAEPALGMTLIPHQGRAVDEGMIQQYYRAMAEGLRAFHHLSGVKVYVFNQVSGPTIYDDDKRAISALMAHVPHQPWIVHVDEVLPAATLKACFGQMQLFLATRLHSGIFALDMGVPTVFIGYGTKTRGMMEGLGLENRVIDIDQVSADGLLERLLDTWENRTAYRQLLASKMPEVTAQVLETAQTIRKSYDSN